MSLVYHPPIDGPNESINNYWEPYLHCFTSKEQHMWEKWQPLDEWWYNTSYHNASQMTPYEEFYGHTPPILLPYTPSSSPVQEVDMVLRNRHQILHILQDNIHMAKTCMKHQADQHCSERTFQVSDMVFLHLHPYNKLICRTSNLVH